MRQQQTITIQPLHVVIGVVALVVILIAGYAAYPVIAGALAQPTDAETAAIQGAEAFLNRDYEAGKDAWAQAVCDVSTSNGCKMMRSYYVPAMWPKIEEQKQKVSCVVDSAEYFADSPVKGVEAQAWKFTGSCTPDGGKPSRGDGYVFIVKSGDGWLFDHLMTNQEVVALESVK